VFLPSSVVDQALPQAPKNTLHANPRHCQERFDTDRPVWQNIRANNLPSRGLFVNNRSKGRPTEREWMERMLEALEKLAEGGKWFGLIDKVYRRNTLQAVWRRAKATVGAPKAARVFCPRGPRPKGSVGP